MCHVLSALCSCSYQRSFFRGHLGSATLARAGADYETHLFNLESYLNLQLYALPGTQPLGPSATINLYPLSPRVRRPWGKCVGARGHPDAGLIATPASRQTTTTMLASECHILIYIGFYTKNKTIDRQRPFATMHTGKLNPRLSRAHLSS